MEVKAKRSAWRAWPRGGGIAVWYWLFVGWWLVPCWWMILGIAWLCGWRSKAGAKNVQMADQVLSAAPAEATGPNPASPPPASVTYVTNITNITAPPEPEVPKKVQCQWCKRQTDASESACEFCGAPLLCRSCGYTAR